MKRSTRPSRHRRDRGATLVEFAIIAPLLFALVFGMIDFGFAFNDWIAVRQGARDAARQAVTGRFDSVNHASPNPCQLGTISPAPPVGTTSVQKIMCLAKERVNLDDEGDIRVMVSVEDPGGAGAPGGRGSIAVCVMYPLESVTRFYGSILDDKVVRTEVQMRTEQTVSEAGGSSGNLAAGEYSEPQLGSNSWAFCEAEATGS